MRRLGPAQRAIQLAQFAQRVGPEAGKHQKAVHRQRPVPARNQRLRIGHLVQQHVGPQHLHPAIGRQADLHRGRRPARRTPPGFGQCLGRELRTRGAVFDHKAGRLRVAARQQAVRLQAAAHRLPVRPLLRLQLDPAQALFHAPRHLFMQPGRCHVRPSRVHPGTQRQRGPARGGDGIDGGGEIAGHSERDAGRTKAAQRRRRSILTPCSAR